MNQNLELLYLANSVELLKEVILLNPNVNEIHPRYSTNALRNLLVTGYFLGESSYKICATKIKSENELLEMIKLFLEAGSNTEYCLDCLIFSQHTEDVKKNFARILLDYGAKSVFFSLDKTLFIIQLKEIMEYIQYGYYLEKIQEKINARKIQQWFLKMYYDPYHPYGKSRLEREFSVLSKELSKKIN